MHAVNKAALSGTCHNAASRFTRDPGKDTGARISPSRNVSSYRDGDARLYKLHDTAPIDLNRPYLSRAREWK